MEPHRCPGCNRSFTQKSNLLQHLGAAKNVRCHDAYYNRSTKPKLGKRLQQQHAPPHNKKRIMDNIETVLQQTGARSQHAEPTGQSDVAVDDQDSFDFPLPDGGSDEEQVPTQSEDPRDINAGNGLDIGLTRFRAYLNQPQRSDLMPNEKAAIELMSLMDTKGGSIALYEAIIDWHVRHLTGNQSQTISADKLHGD